MELRISRRGKRTVWCLFRVETVCKRVRHDMICWSREPNGETRFAALWDMGGTEEEDRGFFRAFAASFPDPDFLLELFEDR